MGRRHGGKGGRPQAANIHKYLVLTYPELKGRIDKFGRLTDRDNERVAVSAYYT